MTNPKIDRYGDKYWYNSDREFHREDGPAIEWADGYKEWCINGDLHREYGPAVENTDGNNEWWIRNIDITIEVNQWISDNNLPDYKEWDDSIKVLFKLKFG